jgi:streptogramin lyase
MGDAWARGIAVDRDGGAWIVRSAPGLGTIGGRVDYVSPDKNNVRSWTGHELLGRTALSGTQEIRAVAVDRNGGLWFGTSGAGVFHCTSPGVVAKVYDAAAGAWPADTPMDNIFAFRFEGNRLYVGSAGGIAWKDVLG